MKNLAEEIEEMRQVLTSLVEQKNYNFMDTEVQALSCKLDKLIVVYQYASMPKKR